MARANDNWERLMGAVLRRNRLWEMFHAHSRTPSISSAASSTDDPFLDLFDDKSESRRCVEDQVLDIKTAWGYRAQGNGKTAKMVEKGRLFDEVIASDEDRPPISGGGLRQYGKFSYGCASSRGRKPSMEDFYEIRIDCVDGEMVDLFGVFDGHDGARAAEFVKENLFSNLLSHPKCISDTTSAIADAYCYTDTQLLKLENIHTKDSGSTACTAILLGSRLFVANVGDSRAVICRAGNAVAVSEDHKPHRTDELRRIQGAGGVVMWTGRKWRVQGVLAVSRTFGHRMLKQYVAADPEIQVVKVDETLEFLILASNGLWDVVTNVEAVSIAKPIQDPEEAATRLMQEASLRGSADNIAIVVVRFG